MAGAITGLPDLAPLVAGPIRLVTSEQPNVIERFEALWRFGQEWWVEDGWAATANLLVQAEAFEAVHGFDTTGRHIGEDVDFCFRARAAGYSLAYCPTAIVEHDGERALAPLLRRCFRHGYSVKQATTVSVRVTGRGVIRLRALIGDRALRQFGQTPEGVSMARRVEAHGTLGPDWVMRLELLVRSGPSCRVPDESGGTNGP